MSAKRYFYIDLLEDLYQNLDDVPEDEHTFIKEMYEDPAVDHDAQISADDQERIERLHGDHID